MPTYQEVQNRPDPVLSQIAIGYANEDPVGGEMVPTVPVLDRKGKYPKWGLEAFRLQQTRRAPRTKANATDFAVTWEPYNLEEHALDFEYEEKERQEYERIGQATGNSAALFNMERDGVRMTESQLQLGREKRTGDRLRSNEVPGELLTGTAQWTDSASDPVAQSRVARREIRRASGKRMNTMLIPSDPEDILLDHPVVKSFLGQNTEQFVDEALLRRIFRVENIIIASQVLNLGTDEVPEFFDVWGRDVIFAYINQNPSPSQLDMSLAYNFRYGRTNNEEATMATGAGVGGDASMPVTAWYDQNTETHIRRVKYEEKVHIVAPGCGYVLREVIN